MVLSFDFAGLSIGFHGRILVVTSVLVLIAFFLYRRLAGIFLMMLFGGDILV